MISLLLVLVFRLVKVFLVRMLLISRLTSWSVRLISWLKSRLELRVVVVLLRVYFRLVCSQDYRPLLRVRRKLGAKTF